MSVPLVTSTIIPVSDSSAVSSSALTRLLSVMQILRDPQVGCPWDCEQTFASIAPYTLEETYEVIDAIQNLDYVALKGELGDLLFQVVFYAQMAKEQQLFDFEEICNVVTDKLIQRHPHVFASDQAVHSVKDSGEVLVNWEQRKIIERAEKSQFSSMDDIPRAMPALMRAQKIQQRCASVGFDWKTVGPVLDKVYEEIDEVMHEAQQAVVDEDKLTEEIGDMLFASVNLARHLGQKAELALHKANQKFERRFRAVEEIIAQQGMSTQDATLEQMEAAWQQVKQQENLVSDVHEKEKS